MPDVTAVVVAGGRGRRLRPLTDAVPKPLLKIGDRSIIERLIGQLASAGISRLFVSVGYMSAEIRTHVNALPWLDQPIGYLEESSAEPLGTAGWIALLPESARRPGSLLLVVNGDLVLTSSLERLVRHLDIAGADAVVGVTPYHHTVPFGVIRSSEGVLVGVDEKPTMSWPVLAGVYVLRADALVYPERPEPLTMVQLLNGMIATGRKVCPCDLDGTWLDVGQPDDLSAARSMLVEEVSP